MKRISLFVKRFLFTTIIFTTLISSSLKGQTVLISPTGDGGFETGGTFAANGWTKVNAASNLWDIGTAATSYAGAREIYVAQNAGTYSYDNANARTSHFYRDVAIPAGATTITLSFYWKGQGESGYDRGLVYTAPNTVTPVANTPASSTTTLAGATLVWTQPTFTNSSTYTLATVTLPDALAGTTVRLIFTWQNDGSLGTSPGTALDNISLTCIVPTPCAGIPTAGTTAATVTSGCSGYSSVLSVTGGSVESGLTYQWESSPTNGAPWTPIAGATSATYSTTVTSNLYYRRVTTCTASGSSSSSASIQLSLNSYLSCYCASAATSTSDMDITKVAFGTINNTSATVSLTGTQGTATGTAGMNSIWTGSAVPVPSFMQGSTNSISITIGGTAYSHRVDVYIDFNHDGDLTDPGESFPIFAYADPTLPNLTTASISIPITALTGNTLMRVVCVESSTSTACGTYTWGETEDYIINITAAAVCSGTPVGGTSVASVTNGCSGYTSVLSVTGSTIASGLTYQWESSPTGGAPWTAIAGATSETYSLIATAGMYYRRVTTCTASGLSGTSSSVHLTINSYLSCFCASAATSTSDMDITKITFGTINNSSVAVSLTGTQGTATGTAGMYSDWTMSTVPVPSVQQGSTVPFSIIIGGTAYSHRVDVYIDFNHDGDLTDPGESYSVFAYANPTLPNTTNYNIQIPLSALTGNTLMRVVCVESSTSTACGTYTWGETEDYIINITAAPACSGTPTGGSTTASTLAGCGNIGAISVTGSTVATGLSYQWYSAPAAAGPWTIIAGATGETYTPSIYGLYYRRVVTCTSSGLTGNSSSIQYSSSAPINDECANATLIIPSASQNCTSSVAGTVACASASSQSNSCSGTADDDVWYKFVATSNIHSIKITNVAGSTTDMYFSVYSGTCGSLTNLLCSDLDSSTVSGLTIGATYYIRAYTYVSTAAQTTTFNICIGTTPPPAVQGPCTNLGFESGFTGWYGSVGGANDGVAGGASPTYVPTVFGTTTIDSQFTIMNSGTDPYGLFPVVYSGSASARIGNESTTGSYSAASIEQTFLVDSTNTDFSYSYAVVLQDGGHTDEVQPFFTVGVFDQSGNELSCGKYLMVAPGVGYIQSTIDATVYYKPWSTVSVNLSSSIGQTVTIKIVASDCAWEAHFGYAYLDCKCASFGIIEPKVMCLGQNTTLTAPPGAASYLWTPGGATTQSITVSPASTTTYTCDMTTSGVTPCNFSLSADVTVFIPGSVTASNDGPVCAGTDLHLTSSPDGATTYNWSGPSSFNSTLQNPTITAATAAAAGVYTVTASFVGGCTGTATTTVVIGSASAPTITNNTLTTILTCTTPSISVTASGGTNYSWSGGATPTTANNSFTTPGTYTVTATTGTCTSTASITITQDNTPPTAGITNTTAGTPTQLTCLLTTITATATGGTTYAWSGGATPTTAANSFTTPNTYVVTVTGANGCTATSSIVITQNIIPPTAGITNTTAGSPTQLTCALTTITATATGGTTYAWSGGATPATAANSFTGPGTYTVTVTAANGCTDTESITITQDITPPTAVITNNSGGATQLTCALTTINVTASGGTGYAWSGGATPATAANSFTGPGTYTVTVTAANGCTDTESITITQDITPPTAVITNNSGGATQLTCALTTINVTASGGTGYAWSGGATPATAANSFTTPGTYTVTVTAANGCTDTESITITQDITPPTAVITNNSGGATQLTCALTTINVTASGGTGYAWSGGATPATAANSFTTAGTYTVTVTATNGCTDTESITITQDITPPTAVITNNSGGATQLTCALTTINVTASGGTGYAWSGGATPATAANSFTTAGTYTVTVTAANGCTDTESITITQDATVITAGITNNSGGATQLTCLITTINVTATPAGASTYAWSGGATPATAVNSFTTPGTYTVTVTAANGCTDTESITITQDITAPTAVITNNSGGATQLTCVLTTINVTASGGTGYAWSGGATPATAANSFTTPGTYTVTVTAANGCTDTESITITQDITAPTAVITNNSGGATQLTCILTTINVTASGGTGYAWSGGATPATAANSFTTPGTYTVTVTAANGCTDTESITITQDITTPTAVITNNSGGATQLTCALTTINVTASGGTGYAWSGGATPATAANSFTTPGTYTVTVTAANGCTDTESITITQDITAPTAVITNNSGGATQLTCALTTINVTASGGTGYSWSGGATPATAANSFTTPGTYTVTVTAANGCTDTESITITQDITAPTAVITNNSGGATQLTCVLTTINVTASGGTGYAWSGGATPATAANSFTTPGTYTVTVTAANGCTDTESITITQDITAPTAVITNNSGGFTELTCTLTSINVTATGGITYAWSGGATPTTDVNSFTTAGTYTVTITAANGCTDTESITITQNASVITANITNNTGTTILTCTTTSISLTATDTGVGTSYVWSGGATPATANNSVNAIGTYTVTATASNGCSATSSITITQNITPPTVGITNNSGGATELTCALTSISVTATPAGATSYAWSGGATAGTANNSFTTPATYTVTVTEANGCTATSSIVITQNITPPTVGITNNSGGATELTCTLTSISVTATPAGATSYAWSGGATAGTANNSFTTPATYTVTVTAANGCTATSSIAITQNITPPTVGITNNSGGATELTCTLTSISVTATPAGATSYAWSGGATAGTANNSFTTPATYTVTVTAANGCTATSSIAITQNITPPTVGITNNSGGATELTCALTSISVTATPAGATSYAWSGGATTGTANNSFTTPGTYTVTVTAANGCTATSSITITQNTLAPTVTITNNSGGATQLTCVLTSINVTASGGVSYTWSGGATPATAANNFTTPGTYTVTATAANGCTATNSIVISQNTTPPVVAITNNTGATIITCTTPSINVTATGGGTYSWSGGATIGTANNNFTAAGTYTVTVTGTNGCTATSSITLTQNITPPTVGITNNTGTTILTCTVTAINVTATGGGTYAWSGGATPATAANSFTTPGTYTVTVTSANGCTATSSITLSQSNTPPTVGITNNSNGATVLTCALTQINVTATGGGTYAWSGGATPTTAANSFTTPASYTVTVTAPNGCTATSSIAITQNTTAPTAGITNNSGSTELTCTLTQINVTATGGGTYVWSGGATPNTASNSFNAIGTYTVTITGTNGCTATSSITITQNTTAPTAGITNNTGSTVLNCNTTAISVEATGGSSYHWSGGATPATAVNSFTVPGTYTVTVTGANGCTSTTDITVTQVAPVVLSLGNTVSDHCSQGIGEATVSTVGGTGTYNYSWNSTPIQSGSHATQLVAGTYQVIVNDGQCGDTISVVIGNIAGPDAAFEAIPEIATSTNPEIRFQNQSTNGDSYAWMFGDGEVSNEENPTHLYPESGNYTVILQVVDAFGCTDTVSHPITIIDDLVIFIPNGFTPDGDGLNDVFKPSGRGYSMSGYEMNIYDRWGQLVFNSSVFEKGWDGKIRGTKLDINSVFAYRIVIYDLKGKDYVYVGHVTILGSKKVGE